MYFGAGKPKYTQLPRVEKSIFIGTEIFVKPETNRKGSKGLACFFPGECFWRSWDIQDDTSFTYILQFCQKFRLVFDFGIRLTVIQKKVGIDYEGNGNKSWVCTVLPCYSSWCGCHAQLLT